VVEDTNDKLQRLADEYSIPTIDPNKIYSDFIGSGTKVGNVPMQLLRLNNDPRNIFLADGVHPGTILNGIFVNKLVDVLDKNLGANIRKFNNEELLQNAGIK
jgi:hypothetical protein